MTDNYHILSKVKHSTKSYYVYLVETTFGVCQIRVADWNKGSRPTIRSALEPLKYFINKANFIHKNTFDYSLVEYINSSTKVKIKCFNNHVFEQTPNDHLSGKTCKLCYHNSRQMSVEEFKTKSNIIHSFAYDYSLIKTLQYAQPLVPILCKFHNLFEQRYDMHLQGQGCPKCAFENNGFNRHLFVKRCAKNNGLGTYYIIRCFNENEEFYKVGITSTSIKRRYNNIKYMPYKYEIVQEFSLPSECAWDLELLTKKYILETSIKYTPSIPFNGSSTECYKFNFKET